MYNVCTLYTTAVGVILPRQLARYLHRNEYDIWCNVCWTLVRGGILLAALTRHALRLWALTRPSAQPTVPCQGKDGRLRFVFATNGTIERFGNLVRQELMNVWRDSILFASLTRHTIVANATIKTVPCHGKSGCLRLRSN
jgi:hypothetical protein